MTPVKHFVVLNGEQQGPFTLTQLRGMWSSGLVNMDTLHFMDGYSEWLPLGFIREDLEESFAATPPASGHIAPAGGRTKRSKKPKSRLGALIGGGILAAFGMLVLSAISGGGRGGETHIPDLEVSTNAGRLKSALAENGVILDQTGRREIELTIPLQESMRMTERQAKEMALATQSRLGDGVTVRVKSPAGQTLAEAGP